jgi:L-alanine-DL-glutamate epimerase-like enolase superfamily enzyme
VSFSLALHHYDIPLARPYVWSQGVHYQKWSIIVEAEIGESFGFGEIAYAPSWERLDRKDFERISGAVKRWCDSYYDALMDSVLAVDMVRVATMLDHLEAIDSRVRCGVSSAIFQALGQFHGTSIHELFSEQHRHEIPINCLIAFREGEDFDQACLRLVQQIRRYTGHGLTAVKCKGTAEVAYDIGLMRVLKAEYPECSFRLDPNGAWTLGEVLRNSDQLNELSLEYIEEPFSDRGAYEALKESNIAIPIAFDHWGSNEQDLARVIDRYNPAAVVIKCQSVGGPDRGARLVQFAEQAGIKAVVTGSLETLVGLSIAAEVAACSSQISAAGILLWEYFVPNSHPAPQIRGGMVPLPLVTSPPELPEAWLSRGLTIQRKELEMII